MSALPTSQTQSDVPSRVRLVTKAKPLEFLKPELVAEALRRGGMYPPYGGARQGAAGLQWRPDVPLDELLQTALNNILGANGTASHLLMIEGDELARRSAYGLVAMLEIAGGAVALALEGLYAIDMPLAGRRPHEESLDRPAPSEPVDRSP